MDQSKPTVFATTQTLPFDKLSPRDFERLCSWLVEREGYEKAEHLGAAGSEQGRDIIAWRDGKLWAFQCKRVQSLGPADAKREVKKVASLPKGERPAGLIFLVTCDVSARARKDARDKCVEAGMACDFWTGTELDQKVQRHSEIVAEFFDPLWKDRTAELRSYVSQAVVRYELRMDRLVHRPLSVADQPYKFLYAFDIEDEAIFFGRDAATEALCDTVLRDRLTVLHAKSGAGKTSLLSAGLSPRLIREGYLPVYARAYDDPVRAIKRAIAPPSSGAWPDPLPNLSLHEFLGLVCEHLSRQTRELVLVLDQFEEFFIFWTEEDHRKPFIDALADCCEDKGLPARIVIGIRTDYFGQLATFQGRMPHIFYNEYYLRSMTRKEAETAIAGPVTRLDRTVTYQPRLLDVLLDDLMAGGLELPHLQIVCTHLYERLTAGETTITLEAYEASGGAKGILSRYLAQALDQLSGRGAEIAKAVLVELVSSQATRRILSYDALAARVEAKDGELEDVLTRLVDARLLRRDEVTGEVVYEMAHEYLVDEIAEWIEREDLELKQVEELLEREVANWRVYGTLIPRDRLELIFQHRERFKGLGDEAAGCIICSGVKANFATADWGRLVGVKPFITALGHEDSKVRRGAAEALGKIGGAQAVGPLISALGDGDSSVRRGAAEALGEIGGAQAVGPLITALGDGDNSVRRGAAEALGEIGDRQAVDPLIAALRDEHPYVRSAAAWALRRMGEPVAQPALTDREVTLLRKLRAAFKRGTEAEGGIAEHLFTSATYGDYVWPSELETMKEYGWVTVKDTKVTLTDKGRDAIGSL